MRQYLITDPFFYGNTIEKFTEKLTTILEKHKIDFICFRDKRSPNIEELATVFLQISQKFNVKYITINSHINLAYKLGFKTLHLNSSKLNKIKELKEDFTIIASTHNEKEIELAKDADFITYSPVFMSPNKGKEKGIEELKRVVEKYPKQNIFALGGIISQNEIDECKKTKCYGFSSIRYFV